MAKSIQLADAFFVEGGDKNAVMRDMSKKPLRFQLPVRLSDGVATDLQSRSKLGFTELLAAVVLIVFVGPFIFALHQYSYKSPHLWRHS